MYFFQNTDKPNNYDLDYEIMLKNESKTIQYTLYLTLTPDKILVKTSNSNIQENQSEEEARNAITFFENFNRNNLKHSYIIDIFLTNLYGNYYEGWKCYNIAKENISGSISAITEREKAVNDSIINMKLVNHNKNND